MNPILIRRRLKILERVERNMSYLRSWDSIEDYQQEENGYVRIEGLLLSLLSCSSYFRLPLCFTIIVMMASLSMRLLTLLQFGYYHLKKNSV